MNLVVKNLSVSFKKRDVLRDIRFVVSPGETLGLLGPNGSGKSTLLKTLVGLRRPVRGSLEVDGRQIAVGAQSLRARIGVVFQEPSLDVKLSAWENLLLGAKLFCVPKKQAEERAAALLSSMELYDRRDDRVEIYSGGMKRRLEIARAMIHHPHMLLMDEPTTGLDPVAFERTWEIVESLKEEHRLTVMLTTHLGQEALRCDRLLLLDEGRIVADDTPEGLLSSVAGDVVTLQSQNPQAVAHDVSKHFGIEPRVEATQVAFEVAQAAAFVPKLFSQIQIDQVSALSLRRPTLADAFFALTGRSLEGGMSS